MLCHAVPRRRGHAGASELDTEGIARSCGMTCWTFTACHKAWRAVHCCQAFRWWACMNLCRQLVRATSRTIYWASALLWILQGAGVTVWELQAIVPKAHAGAHGFCPASGCPAWANTVAVDLSRVLAEGPLVTVAKV